MSLKGSTVERQCWTWPTRYLSVDTLTRIRSSPMRTFSPSDLCLEAGWMVHQQASPVDTQKHHLYIQQVYCPTLSCDFGQSWLLFLVEATRGKEHKNRVSFILVDSFKHFRSSYVKKQHSYSISPMAIDSMPRLGRPEMASLEDLNSIKNSRKQSSELCSVPVSQTVPIESSCSPTSNDSLSVRDLDVFKQVRNWWVKN